MKVSMEKKLWREKEARKSEREKNKKCSFFALIFSYWEMAFFLFLLSNGTSDYISTQSPTSNRIRKGNRLKHSR